MIFADHNRRTTLLCYHTVSTHAGFARRLHAERLPCSYRACVIMFTEEIPWRTGYDLEMVLGHVGLGRLE
jgi:hypothetical protein